MGPIQDAPHLPTPSPSRAGLLCLLISDLFCFSPDNSTRGMCGWGHKPKGTQCSVNDCKESLTTIYLHFPPSTLFQIVLVVWITMSLLHHWARVKCIWFLFLFCLTPYRRIHNSIISNKTWVFMFKTLPFPMQWPNLPLHVSQFPDLYIFMLLRWRLYCQPWGVGTPSKTRWYISRGLS